MPTDYSLTDLTKLTGVSARTVRYYIAQGLLPSPSQQGPAARYSEAHVDRLRLIKKLQAAHLPLAEIRRQMAALPDDQVASLAETPTSFDAPADSALDYIESLLRPETTTRSFPVPTVPAATAAAANRTTFARVVEPQPPHPAAPNLANQAQEPPQPDRAQWERITLDPDVEIHIRRPLTRQQNRRVERLIAIARELLKED